MINIFKSIRFEFDKLVKDKFRLMIISLLIALIIALLLFITFNWVRSGGNHVFVEWTSDLETSYIQLKEQAYHNYLDAVAKIGELSIDSKNAWKIYQYFSIILENKNVNFYESFSTNSMLFSIYVYYQDGYSNVARQLYFQDMCFMVLPLLFAFNIFNTLVKDESTGFDKNYRTYGINKAYLYIGKIIFSFVCFILLVFLFMIVGLVFSSDTKMLIYDGSLYHIDSVSDVYFQRSLLFTVILLAMFVLFIGVGLILKNGKIYYPVSIICSLAFFPLFHYVRGFIESSIDPFPGLIDIPFINVAASDGFLDGNNMKIITPSLIAIVSIIGLVILYYLFKRYVIVYVPVIYRNTKDRIKKYLEKKREEEDDEEIGPLK